VWELPSIHWMKRRENKKELSWHKQQGGWIKYIKI
jgi:hypothetical protein